MYAEVIASHPHPHNSIHDIPKNKLSAPKCTGELQLEATDRPRRTAEKSVLTWLHRITNEQVEKR